ncbi:hypothetical protein CEXT_200361 [Caerostris extrusa]|uniref:Uncharacterized protein n=1 Tax=Caerostris extrusa TaxID=172846 RepID=A0AAV4T073_CAEEX|nr:hypothetical protein CEXT_200361 [Caerostris extrusa]
MVAGFHFNSSGAYRWIEYEEILRQGVSSGGRTREPSKLLPIMMNSSEGRIASSKYTSAKRIAVQGYDNNNHKMSNLENFESDIEENTLMF